MMNKVWITAAAAGTILSVAAGINRSSTGLPSFRNVCEVRASIPGRMRLYIPELARNREQTEDMLEKMNSIEAIQSISVNPTLSTLLVRYDAGQVEPAVIEGAIIRLMNLDAQIDRKELPKLQEKLQMILQALDRTLLDATDGWVDTRMAASGSLLALGLSKGIKGGFLLPGAATLLWWAANVAKRGKE